MSERPLQRLRRICLALPGTEERLSHGEPCWFIENGRQFVSFDDHHHGEDRLAFWCAAPDGSQQAMVESKPDQYFVPPYVGHCGWPGVCWMMPLPRLAARRASRKAEVSPLLGPEWRGRERSEW